jgi:hypothetical protein
MLKIFLGEGMPNSDSHLISQTTPWTTCIKHPDAFIYVRHQSWRDTSRWVTVDRKRPYIVSLVGKKKYFGWTNISSHTTLPLAMDAAQKASIFYDRRLNKQAETA